MITFDVQNESFPLYLSKILSNANTLLHDEAFINFTIEKKELSQMEIIKIDYNSYIAINNLLHPDKQKELLQPSMSTNYLPKNDFITKTTHKRNRTLQEEKIEQSNTLTTHCLSYNQLSIAEQIELDNENKDFRKLLHVDEAINFIKRQGGKIYNAVVYEKGKDNFDRIIYNIKADGENLKDLRDREIVFNLAIIFNDRSRYYEEYKELFMKYLCIANF